MVRRFAQHKHGRTNHDEAWKDIEKLWFMPVSKNKDFTQIESDEICRFRASGKRLRNRALNLGHSQPSSLDAVIPVEDQQSWVLGNGPYNLHGAREGLLDFDKKPSNFFRQIPHECRDLVLSDLAFALTKLLPDAVELEGRYWTISDCPGTGGGRWVTLNTGYLEFMYFPKTIPWLYGEPLSRLAYINTPAGTLLDVRFSEGAWADSSDIFDVPEEVEQFSVVRRTSYSSTDADAVLFCVGNLENCAAYLRTS